MGQRGDGTVPGPAGHQDTQPPATRRPLEGDSVLVTRSPERSEALAEQLRRAGAEPLLLPLKDFERAADQAALDEAFDDLGAGKYSWLVVSSVTTVMALANKAAERKVTLSHWIPAATRVAAVGPSTRSALEAAGIAVHFVPQHDHSAAGLAGEWPGGPAAVLLPQADIAAPALARSLTAQGANVKTVVAYHTVDYPAEPGRRLAAHRPSPAQPPSPAQRVSRTAVSNAEAELLTPAEAKARVDDGRLAAVVAASPSAARRISALLSPLGTCRFVAIGKATAAEAEALGLTVAATATESTPEGLVRAVVRALHPETGGSGSTGIHSSASGTQ